jgi:hypothetical protein
LPTATAASKTGAQKPAPVPNGDFYQLVELITAEEKALVKRVLTCMETKVQPIIHKYWFDDAFPFELLPSFKELGIGGLGFEGRTQLTKSMRESMTLGEGRSASTDDATGRFCEGLRMSAP